MVEIYKTNQKTVPKLKKDSLVFQNKSVEQENSRVLKNGFIENLDLNCNISLNMSAMKRLVDGAEEQIIGRR